MKAIHIRKFSAYNRSELPKLQNKESKKWSESLRIKNLPICFRPMRSARYREYEEILSTCVTLEDLGLSPPVLALPPLPGVFLSPPLLITILV